MKLILEYSTPYHQHWTNECFHYIFTSINNKLKERYVDIEETITNPLPVDKSTCGGCINSVSSLRIINPETNKVCVVTFWDRGLDVITPGGEWNAYNVVQLMGGLGIEPNLLNHFLSLKKDCVYSTLPYPLPFKRSYDLIDKLRSKYNHKVKIKKACFIGALYSSREKICEILSKHPKFRILDNTKGYHFEAYYHEMRKHAITLSLNGNGEYCIRDFETMGMGIPLLRQEPETILHEPIVKNVNYICADIKGLRPDNEVADAIIAAVENNIDNEELLTNISTNNLEYFERNIRLNRIVDLFFEAFNLNLLK